MQFCNSSAESRLAILREHRWAMNTLSFVQVRQWRMQFCSGTHLGVSAVLYAIIQQHTQIADAIYELRAASTAAAAAAASLSKCTIAHILGCSVISVYFKSSRMSMQFGLNSLSLCWASFRFHSFVSFLQSRFFTFCLCVKWQRHWWRVYLTYNSQPFKCGSARIQIVWLAYKCTK